MGLGTCHLRHGTMVQIFEGFAVGEVPGMPIVRDFDFALDVQAALKRKNIQSSGKFEALREMREALALEAAGLFEPLYVYDLFSVEGRTDRGLVIAGGRLLESKAVLSAFGSAGLVALLAYTIGPRLEERAQKYRLEHADTEAIILDALGSLAVSEVGQIACGAIRELSESRGLKASVPLNPGTTHWPMSGQRVFFELLPLEAAGFSIVPPGFIHPIKSISMAIGIGEDVLTPEQGSSCDFCADPELCRRSNPYGILA